MYNDNRVGPRMDSLNMVIKRINKIIWINNLLIKIPTWHYMSQQISAIFKDVEKDNKIFYI